MMKKNYFKLSKLLMLLIVLLPAILVAQITMDKNGKTPVSMKFDQSNQSTVATFFDDYRREFVISEENRMEVLSVFNDKAGAHHRYNQYYKGVQIIGAQYILHEKNASVWYANGHIVSGLNMDVSPAISEQLALTFALQEINADVYMWESPSSETMIKQQQNDANATFYPKGEIKLTSGMNDLSSENMKLVYRFDVFAQEPLSRNWVDVDAKTGEIVNKTSQLHEGDVPGSGASLYNGTVNMTVEDQGGAGINFRLNEATTRGAEIHTYDMQNGSDIGSAVQIESTTADGPWDGVGVSAHWGAEATYDYYLDKHGRNSLDDAGFPLNSYVHYQTNLNNAYWTGSYMLYGDGDGVNFNPLVSLDVVGHELTHGVTTFTSNLIYANESGGLNESFSDIFGNLVEFEVEGYDPETWRVGEDFAVNSLGFRNMANPNEFNNPDCYEGDFWFYNEVHNTSGVQNFWFYLLAEGGSGTNDVGFNYSVTAIGLDDAAEIAYHNNTSFLIPSSNYDDARNGSIACAEAIFGVGSQQALSTAAAWDAVNVDGIQPPPPPAPDNDLCADAIALSCGVTEPGTTIGATFDGNAPFCDFPHDAPGVWYTVEGNGSTITASMCGGPVYDARLTVYEGSCETPICVGADDDACGLGSVSEVSWISTAGTTYYLMVHGWGGNIGDFELTISTDAAPAIAVTPEEFTFYVPLDGSDSDQLSIANTAEGCVTPLNWNIIKTEPALPLNYVASTTISENDVYKSRNATGVQDYEFYVGENTIKALEAQEFFVKYQIRDQLVSIQDQSFSDKSEFYSGLSDLIGDHNNDLIAQIFPYAEIRYNTSSDHNLSYSSVRKGHIAPTTPPVLLSGVAEANKPMSAAVVTTGTITHSLSQTLIDFNSVACTYTGFPTADNSYWRSFELLGFGISSDFDVTEVEIGVQLALGGSGSQPITVNLYTSDGGAFPNGTLNLIGTATYDVPDQSLTMLSLPVSGTATAGAELVVEIQSPDGLANSNGFFIGSNDLGQTGPSYISTVACGLPFPIDLAAIDFPGMHTVINVTGEYEDFCPWLSVSPFSGSTAGGSSDDVNVSVDATGLAEGTYQCELVILSNASNASSLVVPVTMIVDDTPPVITVSDPITLWPPNHKYENLDLSELIVSVVDNVNGDIPVSSVVINSVSSDEPDDAPGNGDGKTINDIVIASDCKSADLRKERQGKGNGRVYEVNVSVADASGNVGTATCLVTVPHDKNSPAFNDGPDHTVNGNCGSSQPIMVALVADNNFGNSFEVINYPNPFKGTTTIQFSLEESNYTKLVVYNSLGRAVATIFDGIAEADQVYKVEFSGTKLAGGVYFYHLQSGNSVNTKKKMLLVK